MTDCFSVLGEARRPWLDVDALKERFVRLSAEAHPDRVHGRGEDERAEVARRYTDLNSAHQVLQEPRQRLLHLIELETGARPRDIQRIPAGTMDLFVEIGQACRDADSFLGRRAQVTSPMLKVALFREGLEWVERLKALQGRVQARGRELDAVLRELNAVWEKAPAGAGPDRLAALPIDRLEEVYRSYSYVARWTEQIQERLVQLASI